MNVIGKFCTPASESSPGCGCNGSRKVGAKVAGTAAVTVLAAVACTACCILPFTLPAFILAGAGSTIALFDHAQGWMTRAAVLAVICAWLWIAWQVRKTQRRPARSAIVVMVIATLLTAVAVTWPLIEPVAFQALGIVKKRAVLPNG